MAQGVISRDLNFVSVVGAVSSATDTGLSARSLQYNPTSRGLTVHVVGMDSTATVIVNNRYSLNNWDDTSTANVTYLGYEDAAGNWYIKKIDETTNGVVTYATITNNPTQTTGYSDAWADILTLTYNIFSVAF